MIQTLTVQNFQCHKQATLNFVPGVNIIAGTSDSGKSALLKALVWVLTNRPQGLGFRNFDCQKGDLMRVALDIGSWRIVRSRSESVNEYFLSSGEETDGQKFVAMKTDVPSDIREAHGLTAINIQTQFQPHYLLSSSPAEVVKVLNEACDLSIIDKVLKGIGQVSFKAKADLAASTSALESAEEKFQELAWVSQAHKTLTGLEAEWERIEEKIRRREKIKEIVGALAGLSDDVFELTERLRFYEPLSKLEDEITVFAEKSRQSRRLSELLDNLTMVEEERASLKVPSSDTLSKIESAIKQIQELEDQFGRLTDSLTKFKSCSMGVSSALQELEAAQAELQTEWANVEECPLCGQVRE